MKIVFFGSDYFAAVNLEALLASEHQVVGCVTQPDKPQGRGMKMAISPIKHIAMEANIPYIQPDTLKGADAVAVLKVFDADVFVVVAYGRLLTQEVLNVPKKFCVNVHGSLLPKYRGTAPVNWAILNGDKMTGVTIQKMALALDAVDIIAQENIPIERKANAAQLRERMSHTGAQLLVRTLDAIEKGTHTLTPQETAQVTYAPKLSKDMGQIDWKKSAQQIYDQIRGLQPWPGAYVSYQDKMLKITQAAVTSIDSRSHQPGEVMTVAHEGITVATSDHGLLIIDVHPPAKNVMPAASFAAGHKVKPGVLL